MDGSIYLYITSNGEAYKIPKPNYSVFKAIPNLANREVLIATLSYKTLNRKPDILDLVSFHRAKLDSNGGYQITQEEMNYGLRNFINYAFSTAESLAESEEPIPLPIAPSNIPTSIEKNALYLYVKEKYPILWPNCSYLVEQNIKDIEENYLNLKNLVKEAYKIRLNK